MDFQELLSHADYNASEVKYKGTVKRYSSVLPPPKKVPKANVQSDSIKRFLEKKKAEEAAKAAEARQRKEQLLALRAQNSKNNKKAKIMASRTKDNDFSKIKLTDDELEAKKKREAVLLRKNLADKVERMKARIEMEEKEKLMPKKRKRKSKSAEPTEGIDDYDDPQDRLEETSSSMKNYDSNRPQKDKVHKPKLPPPPTMSFTELLKIAEKRQVAPVEVPVKKKEEEKLMTKKEKKLMEEELARQRRKQERLLQVKNNSVSKSSNSVQSSAGNKKNISEKEDKKKPVVIHVGKDVSKSEQDTKFKIPKSASSLTSKNVPVKHKDNHLNINSKPSNSSGNSLGVSQKSSQANEQKKVNKFRDESKSSVKDAEIRKKVVPKKNGIKVNPVQAVPTKVADSSPKLDEEALKAKIEKQIREKLEKELEERLAAKFAQFQNNQFIANQKNSVAPKQVKKEPELKNNISKKVTEKSSGGIFKKDLERMIAERKKAMENTTLKAKLPEKPTFHKNPYLDPPRRRLEPQLPPRKRRIESDDDDYDDDEEDDMSDFIVDDDYCQNEEDYSKYIKEIFGYDRNKFLDDDDDEVMESSFAQQMKEEKLSAKIGYEEDKREEERERKELLEKKKKQKLKKLK